MGKVMNKDVRNNQLEALVKIKLNGFYILIQLYYEAIWRQNREKMETEILN